MIDDKYRRNGNHRQEHGLRQVNAASGPTDKQDWPGENNVIGPEKNGDEKNGDTYTEQVSFEYQI